MKTKRSTIAAALVAALALPGPTLLLAADSDSSAAASEQATRGYLGISIQRVPAAIRAQLPDTIPTDQGVMVEQVLKDSPADKAGLRPFDILLSYNDQKLYSPEQLSKLVGSDTSGRPATLKLVRRGKLTSVEVTIGQGQQIARQGPYPMPMQMPRHGQHRHPLPHHARPLEQNARVWESFSALSLRKMDDGRYKAEIEYLATDGKKKRLEFEGSREELRKQILAQEDLPEIERQQLLDTITARDNAFIMPPMPPFPSLDDDFGMPPPPWMGWGPDF